MTDPIDIARRRSPDRSTDGLIDRRQSLQRRLEDGHHRIDQAVASGTEVSAWESFWVQLLREYESICDDLHDAA